MFFLIVIEKWIIAILKLDQIKDQQFALIKKILTDIKKNIHIDRVTSPYNNLLLILFQEI